MSLGVYIGGKAVTLCFLGMGGAALTVFLAVAGTGVGLCCLAVGFYLLVIVCWLVVSWQLESRRVRTLEHTLEQLPEGYLLGEVLGKPHNPVEQRYYDAMKAISRSAIAVAEDAKREKDAYCDYVESWVHELKTPLTACSLILANDADPAKLRRELKRADNLTQSILYYARLRTPEHDTLLQVVQAQAVMNQAVHGEMELLIAAGIQLEVTGDFTLSTDPKQLDFILKQLLINCAKYCPGCRVTLSAENGAITVCDTGPGIPAHELPRVTQRGFTGALARKTGGSTGMGLYIVQEMCRQLGIALEITSREGEGTTFVLHFASLTKA